MLELEGGFSAIAETVNGTNSSSVFISIIFPIGFFLPNKFSAASSVKQHYAILQNSSGIPDFNLKENTEKKKDQQKLFFHGLLCYLLLENFLPSSRRRT